MREVLVWEVENCDSLIVLESKIVIDMMTCSDKLRFTSRFWGVLVRRKVDVYGREFTRSLESVRFVAFSRVLRSYMIGDGSYKIRVDAPEFVDILDR